MEALILIDKGVVVAGERMQRKEQAYLSKLCVEARLLLVKELNSVGRATEAIRVCTAGMKLLPADPGLQGAMDDTVPQVLAAEEFLDAASTALALGDSEEAKETLLRAVRLDVASARLPPLLEAAVELAQQQGDEEGSFVLREEARALGAFDRKMQAVWVAAERAEQVKTAGEEEEEREAAGEKVVVAALSASSAAVLAAAEAAAWDSRRERERLEQTRAKRVTHHGSYTNTCALSPTLPAQHPADIQFPEIGSAARLEVGDADVLTPWVAGE